MNPELSLLHPYPFEKLSALFKGHEAPAGLKPVALSIGEPKHAPPAFVLQALRDAFALRLQRLALCFRVQRQVVRGAVRAGGDAGVVRVHGTSKGIAVTCDVTPRYVAADPRMGARQAVAESWRNLTAVGADPIAITDNLNFGNPERPEIMGQIVEAIKGIGAACVALDYPVISGNVSLYNETQGRGILPTPAIGGVGLVDQDGFAALHFRGAGEGGHVHLAVQAGGGLDAEQMELAGLRGAEVFLGHVDAVEADLFRFTIEFFFGVGIDQRRIFQPRARQPDARPAC